MRFKIKSTDLSIYFFVGVSVLIIPLLFSNSTIDPVTLPRFVILAVSLLTLTLMIVIQSKNHRFNIDLSIIRRMVFPVLLGYLFFSAISLTQALNITEGIFELTKISLSIVFLYIGTIILHQKEDNIILLVKAIIITAIVLSIIGIGQYYQIAFDSIPGKREFVPYGTMANKNLFSSILLLSFPFVLFGVLHFYRNWRITANLSVVLSTFNMIIAQTRAVWVSGALAVIATTIFLIIFYRRFKISDEKSKFCSKRILQIGIILVIVILFSLPAIKESSVQREYVVNNVTITSVSERIKVWSKTLQIIGDHPMFGVGLGNWKIVFPKYGTTEMRSETGRIHFQRPHNDYLWVLSEIGLFGLICYLSIFVIIIRYIFMIAIHSSNFNKKVFSILMFFGLISFLCISFFSYPKERITHLIFLMLIMASVLSVYHKTSPIRKQISRFAGLFLTNTILFFLLFSIVVGYSRLDAERHTVKALVARKADRLNVLISEINQTESRFYNMDPMATPLPWYRGVAYFSLDKIDEAFEDFKAAYKIHPYHIHVLNNLATCYELSGDHQNAVTYYHKVLEISPRFEDALINLSAVYYQTGEYEKAYETLLSCDPNSKNPKVARYLKVVKSKLSNGEL